MEKKFRTLSAYLPSRRPSIPPALPFALQNGYGIPAGYRRRHHRPYLPCDSLRPGDRRNRTPGIRGCPKRRLQLRPDGPGQLYRSNKADGGILRQHQKRRRPGTSPYSLDFIMYICSNTT